MDMAEARMADQTHLIFDRKPKYFSLCGAVPADPQHKSSFKFLRSILVQSKQLHIYIPTKCFSRLQRYTQRNNCLSYPALVYFQNATTKYRTEIPYTTRSASSHIDIFTDSYTCIRKSMRNNFCFLFLLAEGGAQNPPKRKKGCPPCSKSKGERGFIEGW